MSEDQARQTAGPGGPATLSQTGRFAALAPLTPRAELRAYAPIEPAWADGARVRHFLELAPHTRIDSSDPDAWKFPDGAALIRHVDAPGPVGAVGAGRPLETQIMVKREGVWRFTNYLWRADGSEADLVARSQARPVPHPETGEEFEYAVFASGSCVVCHGEGDGAVLGLDARRISSGELRSLVESGHLSQGHPAWKQPRRLGGGEAERAARRYLHANCSHCHGRNTDLVRLLGFSFLDDEPSGLIGRESIRGRGPLLVPSEPDASLLIRVIKDGPGYLRMPPLGSSLRDPRGLELLQAWINEMPPDPGTDQP